MDEKNAQFWTKALGLTIAIAAGMLLIVLCYGTFGPGHGQGMEEVAVQIGILLLVPYIIAGILLFFFRARWFAIILLLVMALATVVWLVVSIVMFVISFVINPISINSKGVMVIIFLLILAVTAAISISGIVLLFKKDVKALFAKPAAPAQAKSPEVKS